MIKTVMTLKSWKFLMFEQVKFAETHLEPSRTSTMEIFRKKSLTIFTKKAHPRCSTGF